VGSLIGVRGGEKNVGFVGGKINFSLGEKLLNLLREKIFPVREKN
jgi:hypothetical protein